MQVTITKVSGNGKTGPITTTRTERESCPTTCPFYNAGCYATLGRERLQWDKLNRGEKGISWNEFIAEIRKIVPRNSLWRHNTAGDLPHDNGDINETEVNNLVNANRGRRGYTYTHHVLNNHNINVIRECNSKGFTVNASTESVEVADKVMSEHGIPAVAVVNSEESRRFFKTESGRKVVTCPAIVHPGKVTCATCGLCQKADREFIIAFPAHSAAKKKVNAILEELA
jgi:hypothetical protein